MAPMTSRPAVLAGGALLSSTLLASTLVTALLPASPAAALSPAKAGSLELVLDASGSMAGADPSGGTKIEAAQKALSGVLQRLPSGTQVGVRAYGGQYEDQARGCADTRLVVPVGPVQPSAAATALAGLRPTGYTPLAASLKAAAADLSSDGPRTIVLVSDGEETCGGNPCEVAEDLADSGVGLRVDTVGYGVDESTRAQLSCIATATGGAYSEAPDGDALTVQLASVAAPGLRRYEPMGTPVTGGLEPLGAPEVGPGQYLDALDPGERSYYSVELADGVTPYVAATMVHPPGDVVGSTYDQLTFSLYGPDGKKCGSSSQSQSQSYGGTPVTVAATPGTIGSPWPNGAFATSSATGTCGAAGRYTFSVERDDNGAGQAALPVEVRVLVEPPVANRNALPTPPLTVPEALADPQLKAPLTPVTGGGSFNTAAEVTSGSYADTIRPGETVYYRVHVGWGQRLAYTVSVPPTQPGTARSVPSASLGTGLAGPSRRGLALLDGDRTTGYFSGSSDDDGLTLGGSTAPVLFRDRDVADTDLRPLALAGDHYIIVKRDTSSSDDAAELPVRLAVSVVGDEVGAPAYGKGEGAIIPEKTADETRSDGTTTTQASDDTSSTGPWRTVAYTGGGAVALALAGGLLLVPLLRGRRRSQV